MREVFTMREVFIMREVFTMREVSPVMNKNFDVEYLLMSMQKQHILL